MKILIIEDDVKLSSTLENALRLEGYETECCADGETGLYYFQSNSSDFVILDWMLPEKSGPEILRIARKAGIMTPVLMLTAMGSVTNKVQGLDAGADDYLSKPFDMRELLARIRAHIRRPAPIENNEELLFGDLQYEPTSLKLTGPLKQVEVSKTLGLLLELFMKNGDTCLPRRTIFARVWGVDSDVEESIIENYVGFLRRRFKSIGSAAQIKTVRGVGYALSQEGTDADKI